MNNAIKILLVFLFFVLNFSCAFGFSNPFGKKQPKPKAKMVETLQEWEVEAQNIPIEDRKITKQTPETNGKIVMPKLKYTFDRFNYPQGKREVNIEDIKRRLNFYPYLVADKDVRYVAYPFYHYSPDSNQISSNFYVEKLDTSLNKTQRILNYNHIQKVRVPIIEAGTKEIYPNLFRGLSVVDWSADSKKILIKEKLGSTQSGIYRTYLYLHFLAGDVESGKTIKLDSLHYAIKDYYLNWEKTKIIKYRYDIEPLGFSAENDNIIMVLCYVFDKDNNKIFLGTWGYNCANEQIILFSKTDNQPNISMNGLILKHSLK